MEKRGNNRWWEFYGIRYAMGTVVGAVIVLFLFRSNSSLSNLLFLPQEAKDFNGAHLTLLAVYGLTYCYLASAPILVLYLSRAHLKVNAAKHCSPLTFKFWVWIFAAAVGAGVAYYWWGATQTLDAMWQGLVAAIFAILFVMQLVIIFVSISSKRGKDLASYCSNVATKRSKKRNEGFVETYRHMREHGNSYMIVFFELVLGIILYAFVNSGPFIGVPPEGHTVVTRLTIVVLLWVVPAMFVWVVGLRLENYLVYKN